jgi:tRNA1(Val) A37 N6-methylase TrmN6
MNWTEDAFLGGSITLRQPARGFRAGSDAVLLAAAIPVASGQTVLDVGTGVGTIGLCLRRRVPDCRFWGIEMQASLAEAARENAAANGESADFTIMTADLADRTYFRDQTGPGGRPFLNDGFDHVLSNPPFYADGRAQGSPDAVKQQAHMEGTVGLTQWIRFCQARLRAGGSLTLIHRTDRLPEIITEMQKSCGSLQILPLWPDAVTPAKRIIIRGIKGDRGPLRLLRGAVLHEPDGTPSELSEKIMRKGGCLTDLFK